MSVENPFSGKPEQGEKKDPQQEAVDTYFEFEATRFLEDNDDDFERVDRKRKAMQALLNKELLEKLGEPYTVTEEESGFYLANRERPSQGWDFDPKETLTVRTNETIDLPTGSVRVPYAVFALSKKPNAEWLGRMYDTPVIEDAHMEFEASNDALKRVYAALEAEYQAQAKFFEQSKKEFEDFTVWAEENAGKHFLGSDWEKFPALNKIMFGVDCKTFNVYLDREVDGKKEFCVAFEGEGGQILDIQCRAEPVQPKRAFPPMERKS